jgi:hypothetical protein
VVVGAVPRFSVVAPVRFYRPYYAFRPRFSLGFGLWAGYPIAYPYAYYDPFYYPYYSSYGYPYPAAPYPATAYPAYPPAPQGPPPANDPYGTYSAPPPAPQGQVGVQQQNQQNMGGLSFDIRPSSAQLVVDGQSAGTVGQFTSTSQPLGLTAGRHHVEIRAEGFHTMSFDVDIIAGQVIPYQGELEH